MRLITMFIVFFLAMNVFAGIIQTQASSTTLNPEVNAPDALQDAQDESDAVSSSGGGQSTLFGMIQSIGNVIGTLASGVLPAFSMMVDAGVPEWIVGYFSAVVGVPVTVEFLDFLRGLR